MTCLTQFVDNAGAVTGRQFVDVHSYSSITTGSREWQRLKSSPNGFSEGHLTVTIADQLNMVVLSPIEHNVLVYSTLDSVNAVDERIY